MPDPKFCPACATPLEWIELHEDGGPKSRLRCPACSHTGYQGRTGIFELLVTDDAIRAQIHNRAAEADIRSAARTAGMLLMREDGERLVQAGVTSREELLRVTRD